MRPIHTALFTVVLATALSLPTLAAKKDKTKGLPPASGNNIPEVDDKAMKDAKVRLGQSEGKLERAQDALTKTISDLKKQSESAPEISEAQNALRQAQADYDAATGPILERVRAGATYQSALEAKKAASKRVQELQAESPVDQDQVTQAARIVLDKGKAVTQLESGAVAADRNAAALKEKVNAANIKLLKLRHDLEESIKNNPQVVAARSEVEEAQKELPPVQAAYNSELEKYNSAVAAREKALNDTSKRPANSANDGPGYKKMKKKA
jgi:DNA repair exonuclease SbcCD ATPase subunit